MIGGGYGTAPAGTSAICTCGKPYWSIVPIPCPVHGDGWGPSTQSVPYVARTGWICPRCSTVHSPDVEKCEACAPTVSTGTFRLHVKPIKFGGGS